MEAATWHLCHLASYTRSTQLLAPDYPKRKEDPRTDQSGQVHSTSRAVLSYYCKTAGWAKQFSPHALPKSLSVNLNLKTSYFGLHHRHCPHSAPTSPSQVQSGRTFTETESSKHACRLRLLLQKVTFFPNSRLQFVKWVFIFRQFLRRASGT